MLGQELDLGSLIARQIGNAVPPKLAKAIALHLGKLLLGRLPEDEEGKSPVIGLRVAEQLSFQDG